MHTTMAMDSMDSVDLVDPGARRMEILVKDSLSSALANCSALLPPSLIVGPGEVTFLIMILHVLASKKPFNECLGRSLPHWAAGQSPCSASCSSLSYLSGSADLPLCTTSEHRFGVSIYKKTTKCNKQTRFGLVCTSSEHRFEV